MRYLTGTSMKLKQNLSSKHIHDCRQFFRPSPWSPEGGIGKPWRCVNIVGILIFHLETIGNPISQPITWIQMDTIGMNFGFRRMWNNECGVFKAFVSKLTIMISIAVVDSSSFKPDMLGSECEKALSVLQRAFTFYITHRTWLGCHHRTPYRCRNRWWL